MNLSINYIFYYSTICLIFILNNHKLNCKSFYDILEVGKQATLKEIKESYRHLAKKWHPDLNKNEKAANEKLHLLNEAYKTLSDSHTRSMYDLFGKGASELDLFLTGDHLIEGDTFQLPISSLPTLTELLPATNKLYDNALKQQSQQQPQLLLACRDEVEEEWLAWANKLALDGVRTYSIDSIEEGLLLRRLRYPSKHESCMGALVDGRVQWSCPIAESYEHVLAFVVQSFPPQLAPALTNDTYETFLETNRMKKNHVSMVLFSGSSPSPPLPLLTALFSTRAHVTGAYVFYSLDSKSLFRHFGIANNTTTLLVFKEDHRNPVFKFSLPHISSQHYKSIIKTHPTLHAPRLSCPHLFDLLCPINTHPKFKSLCVLLLKDADDIRTQEFVNSFRLYSQDYRHKDRVKFAHVSSGSQKAFVHLLTWGKSPYNESSDSLEVVILWRKEGRSTLNFDVLEGGWVRGGGGLARSRRRLTQALEWLLRHPNSLANVVEMRLPLRDEHLSSIWIRIGYRLLKWLELLVDFFLGVEDCTYTLLGKSTLFMLAAAGIVAYLHRREMRMLREKEAKVRGVGKEKEGVRVASAPLERPVIQIYQMGACNYDEFVLRSASGVRLILLLVDSASKNSLANYFGSFLQPYVNSKAFRFACVDLDKYFEWYKEVLELTLKQSAHYLRLKRFFNNINIKNCLGTVLAINGAKKYYYMYHISHYKAFPSSHTKDKWSDNEGSGDDDDDEDDDDDVDEDNPSIEEMTFGLAHLKRRKVTKTDKDADKHTDKQTDKEEGRLFEFDLLRGLGRWLERMCQGGLKKFRLTHWPPSMH